MPDQWLHKWITMLHIGMKGWQQSSTFLSYGVKVINTSNHFFSPKVEIQIQIVL